jgi:hypothetical protein
MTNTIADLIEKYRQNAIGMGNISDPKKANKCHDAVHACYKVLRETKEGREAIIRLLKDAQPEVRCGAAAHSLQWVPELARPVLEALRDSWGPCSFEAEMVLKEYDKGRLTFDY